MYLGVAGACAEQSKNALVEYADLDTLTTVNSANYGAALIELVLSPTELIAGELGTTNTPAQSYTYSGSIPSFASPNDTLSLNGYASRSLGFGDDGNYFYVGRSHVTKFSRFTLSTPYDIGTAGLRQDSGNVNPAWSPQGLHLHPDGDTMYACAEAFIYKLSMTTNWQISSGFTQTAAYDLSGDTDGLGDAIGGLTGIRFSPTGKKMYVCYAADTSNTETGSSGHSKVTQFNLSTAWDVTSRSLDSTIDLHPTIGYFSFTPPNPPSAPEPVGVRALVSGIDFSADGTKLYVSSAHQDSQSLEYKLMEFS